MGLEPGLVECGRGARCVADVEHAFRDVGGLDEQVLQPRDALDHRARRVTGAEVVLRLHGDAAGCRSADDIRVRLPDEYEMALDVVEDTSFAIRFLCCRWSAGAALQNHARQSAVMAIFAIHEVPWLHVDDERVAAG